jgi:tRNA threonylcarbamoyladenosine biosynthesis protein TsaB
MAMAQGISLIGIPTLDIVAAGHPVQELPLAAVLRAGRGRLAVSWYHAIDGNWRPDQKTEVLTIQELASNIQDPTLVCGELSHEEIDFLIESQDNLVLASPARSLRRPAYLAELAWARWKAGKTDNPTDLVPTYLHHKDPIPG